MNEKVKTIILIILVIAGAIGLTALSYFVLEPQNMKESNTVANQNEVVSNVKQNEVKPSNTVENKQEKIEENKTKNEEENKKEEVATEQTTGETNEEKAINAVKRTWGSEEGVYFASMGIDSKGRYIVSVNDSVTSAVYGWYNVDIQTGEVNSQ